MKGQRNIAVLLAGGSGRRMGGAEPKQLIMLGGKTVLEHCIDAFQQNDLIDEIIIVSNAACLERVRQLTKNQAYNKVRRLVEGGKERRDSTLNALRVFSDINDRKANDINLIFHDVARPLVSQRIITDVCSALDSHLAVAVAIPCTDTIFQVRTDTIKAIPNRTDLMAAQTPQAFCLSVIRRAYQQAQGDMNFLPTDDCGVLLRYLPEVSIHIIMGDDRNRKMTYHNDIAIMEALLDK